MLDSGLSTALDLFARQCWTGAENNGFHEPRDIDGTFRDASFGERIALIHSEASEALEAYRASGMKYWTEVDGKPQGVLSEVADIIIRCFDLAYMIDNRNNNPSIGEMIEQKMAYNATREHRHGGKAI